jgi:hypothetical protein
LAQDETIMLDHRLEVCRYLFVIEEVELAQTCLLDIIEDVTLDSEYRYRIIAGYLSKTGISTVLNATKFKIPYNEEFVYGLQIIFFANKKNDSEDRILSGQFLLQCQLCPPENQGAILDELYNLAQTANDEKLQADAADVILRLGSHEWRDKARAVIIALGKAADGTRKTIYDDEQNTHDEQLTKSVEEALEQFLKQAIKIEGFHEVFRKITALINAHRPSPTARHLILKALNRISVDTATFTSKKVTMAEVLCHVWARIEKHKGEQRLELEKRLLQELQEMAGWCGTGHAWRLVNVLSGYDKEVQLKISWDAQVKANISGRMLARMRQKSDHEQQDLRLGMLKDETGPERETYLKFAKPAITELRHEMQKEFVEGRWLTSTEFRDLFEKYAGEWL